MYQDVIKDPGGESLVRVISSACIVDDSILLVPADTIALFVCNGMISAPYGPGRYEIKTGVNPFFVKLRNFMTRGDPGITCQVWYVNIKYENCCSGGTGDFLIQERRFRITVKARASYIIRYVISDPQTFISKLVGMHQNIFDNDDIQLAMDSMLLPAVKQKIISGVSLQSVYTIQNDLTGLGRQIRNSLEDDFRRYGLSLRAVAITGINILEDGIERLKKFEDKNAEGIIDTDIEVDNVKRVYGNVENRTRTEMVTGTLRGKGVPLPRETSGLAGMMVSLPIQGAVGSQVAAQAGQMMGVNNMATPYMYPNMGQNTGAIVGVTPQGRPVPPNLPVRQKVCPRCHRSLDASDSFCRYCGTKL